MTRHTRAQAIICVDTEFLLLKMFNKKLKRFYYMYPGGSVEKNESDKEAIIRELLEECNLHITSPTLIDKREGLGIDAYQYISTYLVEGVKKSDISIGLENEVLREIVELVWINVYSKDLVIDALNQKNVQPSIYEIVNLLKEKKSRELYE